MKTTLLTAFVLHTALVQAQDIGKRPADTPPSPAIAPNADHSLPTPQVDKFVRNIVLCGRQAKTTRWLALPRLEITSESPTLKAFVETSFASISQATGLTTTGDGVVHVFIGSGRDFLKLEVVRRRKLTMMGKNACHYWQNKDQSLKEAFVFVKDAPDLTEEYRQHVLFHDLLASFGFMKNSPQFADSTFGTNQAFDIQLSSLDVKLISFCYRHVPPNAQSSDITKLLKLHWGK
ncbi:MAG: hypothetical protein ACKVY0_12815 [Prosthecobacter sp.]|uniref:hypothetical protein n=1 Tax=Prosthecobacter sp. TaxID=1965333 RepID=UPI0038FFC61D